MHEIDPLSMVRSGYDVVAESYARLLPDASFEAPADRRMIEAFVAHVCEGSGRPVVDAGCGTGRMIPLLSSLGADVSGIDVSAGMIGVARRNNPEFSLGVAALSDLPYPDMHLGGVFAWYSIIHSLPGDLPGIFAEFFRVLVPGGFVLLSFHAGEGRRHLSHAYGHDVSMDAHLFTPAVVTGNLAGAGFSLVEQLVREPGPREKTPQAVLLAQRPPMGSATVSFGAGQSELGSSLKRSAARAGDKPAAGQHGTPICAGRD
jgi:ubiquinone/menaquinone biosynthesis C-methylase UbiE